MTAATWAGKYWREHPVRSVETFGRQITMGGEALSVLDLRRQGG